MRRADAAHDVRVAEGDEEPGIDWSPEASIILLLMRLEAKLDLLIELLEEDGGEEEEGFDS